MTENRLLAQTAKSRPRPFLSRHCTKISNIHAQARACTSNFLFFLLALLFCSVLFFRGRKSLVRAGKKQDSIGIDDARRPGSRVMPRDSQSEYPKCCIPAVLRAILDLDCWQVSHMPCAPGSGFKRISESRRTYSASLDIRAACFEGCPANVLCRAMSVGAQAAIAIGRYLRRFRARSAFSGRLQLSRGQLGLLITTAY
ncbi:hypothetical protein B0H11DRAFT_225295 [Mycena galericulata]|nr:hypothetical protein B0H11DRAFT_225295 [Mycena galericulata]